MSQQVQRKAVDSAFERLPDSVPPEQVPPRHLTTSADFRADINGLRGLAVTLVVLFHFHAPGFSGGFIGVDIFFVISGYLITQVLYKRMSKGRIAIGQFYSARLLRIFPAMLLLVSSLMVLGYFFLEPAEYARLGTTAAAALGGVVNYLFYSEIDYFAPAQESNWLLHFWTLAVELQFYLVFPLVLLLTTKLSVRTRLQVLTTLALASFALAIHLSTADSAAAFFFTPTRVWEFIVGAIVFHLRVQKGFIAKLLSTVGIVLLLAAIPASATTVQFSPLLLLIPVLGSALILCAPTSNYFLLNPLSSSLGSISYSLYLWHWPVIVAARSYGLEMNPLNVFGLVAAMLILATISYLTVERVFRRRSGSARKPLLVCLAWLGITAAATLSVVYYEGLPHRVSELVRNVNTFLFGTGELRQDICFISPPAGGEKFADTCFNPPQPVSAPEVLIFGDSHAGHLWPGIANSPQLATYRLLQATAGACPPLFVPPPPSLDANALFNPKTGVAVGCHSIVDRVAEHIRSRPPALAIIAGRWAFYDSAGTDVATELERMISFLKAHHVQVVLVGQIPEWTPTLPQKAQQESFRHGGHLPERLIDSTDANHQALDTKLALLSERLNVQYLSLRKLLCTDNGCLTQVEVNGNRTLLNWDHSHLTFPGTKWVAEHGIVPAIVDKDLPVR